jgi:hypothetical protein
MSVAAGAGDGAGGALKFVGGLVLGFVLRSLGGLLLEVRLLGCAAATAVTARPQTLRKGTTLRPPIS